MEELEERHQVEIKVYKQKVKHLLYEHQNNVSQLKEECEVCHLLQITCPRDTSALHLLPLEMIPGSVL